MGMRIMKTPFSTNTYTHHFTSHTTYTYLKSIVYSSNCGAVLVRVVYQLSLPAIGKGVLHELPTLTTTMSEEVYSTVFCCCRRKMVKLLFLWKKNGSFHSHHRRVLSLLSQGRPQVGEQKNWIPHHFTMCL